MMGLTARQADCLAIIRTAIAKRGIAPSYDEIAAALGVRSKSNVFRLVDALTERGYLRRLPNRARGISLAQNDRFDSRTEAGLNFIADRTGRSRDALVRQAVDEFLARQVRA